MGLGDNRISRCSLSFRSKLSTRWSNRLGNSLPMQESAHYYGMDCRTILAHPTRLNRNAMNPPNKFEPAEAVKTYLPLMHEFAIRADLVAKACDGQMGLTPPFAREFAYLQFRRMCELMALGSLYLHGDLPIAQGQALKKEWHAEKLMKLLHKNHPFAFPQAIERTKTEHGWHIQGNCKPDALSYTDFLQLYAECGSVLHRGTIRTVQAASFCSPEDYDKVIAWQRKLVTLMNEHMIDRASTDGIYVVSLRTDSGYPECSIFNFASDGHAVVHVQKMTVSDDIVHSYVSNHRT